MTTDVVPVVPELLTAASVKDAVQLQRDYLALCEALLDADDFQDGIKKKSAWRKLAAAFNVSDTITERHYDYDDAGRIVRAEFVVEATAPNGRSSVGVGLASRHDRRFNNPEHDIPATAHTRAKNRAFSDLFGLGEVSAEEVDRGGSRDNTSGVTWGSGRAAGVGQEVQGVEGTDDLEKRLVALPVQSRNAFKDWRRSRGLTWPPTTKADLMTMTGEVARIEVGAKDDQDAYGSSASGTDAHKSDSRRRRQRDKAGSDNGGTEVTAPDPAPRDTTTDGEPPTKQSPEPSPTPTLEATGEADNAAELPDGNQ